MNWLNNLLRTPAEKSPSPQTPGRPAAAALKPPANVDELRRALAAASDEDDRRQRAEELGCALAALLQHPLADDAPGVWTAAACHAADKALALAWLAQVAGDAWLGEVAQHGRFAEVRLAAAQRIEDGAVLDRVARNSRHKDNGVYRHCSDVLRQRRQAGERAQRATQLAADLRALLGSAPLSVSGLLDLQQDLRDLEHGAEPLEECRMLLDQAGERLNQEAEIRRRLKVLEAQAQALAIESSGAAWRGAEALDQWRNRLAALTEAQAGLPQWLAEQAPARAHAASLLEIESRLSALATEGASIQACEQFLAQFAGASIDAAAATAWDALPKPGHEATEQALQARWQALQSSLAPPPPAVPERPAAPRQARIDLDAVRGLLEQLEQALEEGHLARADAAARQIKATVAGGALRSSLESRLQRALGRLGELRGWAQWGVTKSREQLIAAARELLAGEQSVDRLALAVPALREEWKRLDAHGPSTKGQWESFDHALEKAYRPVAARRAEEAARREQARVDKEALCAQCEAAVSAIDWERPDYPAIEAQRQRMLGQWRAAPRAGSRDERALRKRFDTMIGSIDQRVEAARGGEIQRREQLIAAAEALREAGDLRRATSEAKVLQERWRSEAGAMRLSRGDEQKLWQRFRTACDGVFGRRDAQRAEQVALREQRAQARGMLLETFAATLAAADVNETKRALAQFRADWEAAREGPAESSDSLERRARDLQHQAQQRIDALRRETYRARLQLLAQQAPPAEGMDADTLAAGQQAREALLIDLEIALGLPSPQAYLEARRRRQLERLQRRFGAGPQLARQPEELLAQFHATAAIPDPCLDPRVAAVVQRLVDQEAGGGRR